MRAKPADAADVKPHDLVRWKSDDEPKAAKWHYQNRSQICRRASDDNFDAWPGGATSRSPDIESKPHWRSVIGGLSGVLRRPIFEVFVIVLKMP